MSRNQQFASLKVFLAAALLAAGFTAVATADPLPGRDKLKFSQQPMINTTVIDNNGTVGIYQGHDELSTAYSFNNQPLWQGKFMADDFADNFSTPVVHVKWWGSYLKDVIDPSTPVNKFLISFESDIPAGPAPSFSRPGQPLLNQTVFRGALAPGSGTFTEKLIRGPDPILGESLYEYNAELHLGKDFKELKDTVYWLKIVAMVDVPLNTPTFDPYNPQSSLVPITQWGWHNRDYTIQDTLASPNVAPGEFIEGIVGVNQPVWHFQDDAVSGDVRIAANAAMGIVMPDIFQANMSPQFYIDGVDGPASSIPGTHGIGQFSKDLAFELYTVVPEPSSCLLLIVGLAGLARRRR